MSRKVIIVGNWKMNKTIAETKAFIEEFKPMAAGFSDVEFGIAPAFTSLAAAVEAAKGTDIRIGAQNVHWAEAGAFTGEVSAAMLREIGVEFVIVGHSERRQYFGETDATVNQRTKAALAAGLDVIVCIGELLEERENGKTEEVLKRQIAGGLAGLSETDMGKIVVAYEPVWAIGTGKTATPDMADETQRFCRQVIAGIFGDAVAEKTRIQYGGSMKGDNAGELVAQPNIDGGLIGGASLKAAAFAELITNAVRK